MKQKNGMGRRQGKWWERTLNMRFWRDDNNWSQKSVAYTKRRSRRRQRHITKEQLRKGVL